MASNRKCSDAVTPTSTPFRRKILAVLIAQMLAAGGAHAATLNVAPTEVAIDVNGRCSLIEAIENANADAALHPDCPAGSGPDVIQLARRSVYPLLTVHSETDGRNGLPSIVSDITLRGNGAHIARDSGSGATPAFRLLHIAATGKLTVRDTGLRSGNEARGGGIFNRGTLALVNSLVAANTAVDGAGLYNVGTATLTTSTVAGNVADLQNGGGGGIRSEGTLAIIDSSITQNFAGTGGGIFNDGPANLLNSTVAGNGAFGEGGGGLTNRFDILKLNNSTVSSNIAGGGILHGSGGVIHSINSTIANNSAFGLRAADNSVTVHLTNTIIAKNGSVDCAVDNAGSLLTNVNNFIADGSCGAAFSGDPGLGPLERNGGPTQTHALLPGSPAIDTGANCKQSRTRDQRGIVRGALCDIGAFEFETAPPTAKASASNVSRAGAATHAITVVYRDNGAIDITSLGNDDIQVDGPNGFSQAAQLVSISSTANGTPRTAAVKIVPPGGRWDAADNGVYNIRLNAGAVRDISGNAATAGVIGSFTVNIVTP